MPFIFNNTDYLLIDNGDEFDKNEFVVAKKLFIRYKSNSYVEFQEFTEDLLRKNFQKYGTIESIEMLANGEPEGYVTFADDHRACLAFLHHKKDGCDFDVQPAYTWHQPTMNDLSNTTITLGTNDSGTNLNTSLIFKLNYDCFMTLFDYCDIYTLVNLSEVCTKFKSLLDLHYFPLIRSLKIEVSCKSDSMTLGKIRKILPCIGHHIEKLELKFKTNELQIRSYLQKIVKYIGENIRELSINARVGLREDLTAILQPIGKYLEKIYVYSVRYSNDSSNDFFSIFPNIRRLKCELYYGPSTFWSARPKLNYWGIHGTYYHDRKIDEFRFFLNLNPQLEGIEFHFYDENQIPAIIENLPNIKEITIFTDSHNFVGTERSIIQLKSLNNLSTLCVWIGSRKDNSNEMLDCLNQFVGLRKLNLCASKRPEKFQSNQEKIYALSKNLSHLEHFGLRGIKMQESTLVDFVRSAIQLKRIVLKDCDIFATKSLIEDIVNFRRLNQNPQNGPLELIFYGNQENGLAAIGEKDVRKYLIVKTKRSSCCSIYKKNVEDWF